MRRDVGRQGRPLPQDVGPNVSEEVCKNIDTGATHYSVGPSGSGDGGGMGFGTGLLIFLLAAAAGSAGFFVWKKYFGIPGMPAIAPTPDTMTPVPETRKKDKKNAKGYEKDSLFDEDEENGSGNTTDKKKKKKKTREGMDGDMDGFD